MKQPVKIAVVGCGGIGGTLAARLTRAGLDVTPVTGNAEIASALAAHGYRVQELDGTTWSAPSARPPRVALQPGDGPFDVCVVATKATTLADALRAAEPQLRPGATIVCCQNGLPEERAAEVVDRARIVGAVVGFGATMTAPGVYTRTSRGGLTLGRPFTGAPDPGPLAALLGRAEETGVVDDLGGVRWSKLAINCATSTLGAIGGDRLGALLRRRFARRLVLEIWTEAVEVAQAAGVTLAPVGGTLDIGAMALTPTERAATVGSPRLAWKHSILLAVGVKYRRMRSSMLVALERGRAPEIDFLNGELVRRGWALGVPTPVNERLVAAVGDLVAGRSRPGLETLRRVYDDLSPVRDAEAAAA